MIGINEQSSSISVRHPGNWSEPFSSFGVMHGCLKGKRINTELGFQSVIQGCWSKKLQAQDCNKVSIERGAAVC
jgi:hypothetical protein